MPSFELKKGSKFQLDKGIQSVKAGLGWNAGDNYDLDADAFGLVHLASGAAKFYNDGSHAAFYGNKALKKPNGTFVTTDGSMTHSGDDRTGGSGGDDETITVDFDKLPAEIVEIAFWVTIYDAGKRKQNFGQVKDSYIRILNADTNAELCKYKLKDEFAAAKAVQVGSMVKKDDGIWEFQAIGAGADVEIDAICEQYS